MSSVSVGWKSSLFDTLISNWLVEAVLCDNNNGQEKEKNSNDKEDRDSSCQSR